MRGPLKPLLATVALLAALALLLVWMGRKSDSGDSLMLYCAVVMKAPMTTIATNFQRDEGIPVSIQYGGSGTLLSSIRVSKVGDLYIAADSSYTDLAAQYWILSDAATVATLRPVIVVPHGNPKGIRGIEDLLKPGIKVALGNPDAASIGKQTEILMKHLEKWAPLDRAVKDHGVFKPTVNEVANDVKLGTVNAGIVWDATANLYPELDGIPIAGTEHFTRHVTVGLLKFSKHPESARRFIAYLTDPGKGQKTVADAGLTPIAGEADQ